MIPALGFLTQGLEEDLERVRQFVRDSVPVYAALLELLKGELRGGLADRFEEAWVDRSFRIWYERPLLLLAALRMCALSEGSSHPLWHAIGEVEPSLEAASRDALRAALSAERIELWSALRSRAVQTNETTRAVAWLWLASLIAARRPGVPIELHDIGASAGLNLIADRLSRPWVDVSGQAVVGDLPAITLRRGYDPSPLDVRDEESSIWLRACIWPGQRERLTRLDAAVSAWRELSLQDRPPILLTARAGDVPATLPRGAAAVCIAYQTVMRDYLSEQESRRYDDGMHTWLSESAGDAFWVELEPTKGNADPERSAALTIHWASSEADVVDLELARCHPHPQRLFVDTAALGELLRVLA
jgi:hypothetical protein